MLPHERRKTKTASSSAMRKVPSLRKVPQVVTPLSLPLSPWCPASNVQSPMSPTSQSDTVLIKDAADTKQNRKEIYISCCDAIGLGCMVARAFIDFGLRIITCDFSTDGRYCFIMFKVEPTPSCSSNTRSKHVDWQFLKETLLNICPADTIGALYFKPKFSWNSKVALYYILTVKCDDRQGLINYLIRTFWRFNMTIHRLKCITTPDDKAIDEFYISDIRPEGDAENSDSLEALIASISENLEAVVEMQSTHEEYDTSIRRTRKRNYDNYKPLRTVDSRSPLIDSLSEPLLASPSKSIDLAHAADTFSENIRTYGGSVEVEVDNSTSPDNTILRCMCPDRKGILYDFFRLLSDVTLKASYGRVATSNSMCEALVFVKDSKTGGQIDDKKVQKKLKDLITRNIAKPFQLFLTASPKAYCLEVKIVAPVDTSGRGRPKVIFDVTSALNGFDEVRILEAEMYTVGTFQELNQKEIHIFLIKSSESETQISTALQEKIYERVFCQLMGVMKTTKNSLISYYPTERKMSWKKRDSCFCNLCNFFK